MKLLFIFLVLVIESVMAWELPQVTGASDIRYVHERQEVLVRNEQGVWRFDTHGRFVRSPSRSTQVLWEKSTGKAPASLPQVHAVYAPASGVVFMLVPDNERVQVLKLRE